MQFLAVAACLCLAGCGRTAGLVPFETGAGQADFAELNAFAKRANAAYDTSEDIRRLYPDTVVVGSLGKTDVQYFVEHDQSNTQYVTIRGTANARNIEEDVEIGVHKTRTAPIPLADGFGNVARILYEDAAPHLDKQRRTFVTGHSLGGAVAAILALHLIADGYSVDRVVTFGQPRFLTSAGLKSEDVRQLESVLTRVVDGNDIVPMLPRSHRTVSEYGPFEHVGREIILLDGPYFVYLQNHVADHLNAAPSVRSLATELSNHRMVHYMDRLLPKVSTSTPVRYEDRSKYMLNHRD